MYTCYLNILRTDQGSVFTSGRFKYLTNIFGAELRISGFKAHNALGMVQRQHDP